MEEKSEKHPVGRPTLYKPEYCEQMIRYMSQGKSYTAFASTIGVTRDCLYKWEAAHPEFLYAKNIAQSALEDYMLELAHSQMIDGKLNTSAWIFMMKNMCKWKDKVENTVEAGKSITLNYSLDG